jgi:hypothetical protein
MFENKKLGQVILESCKQKRSPARGVPVGTSSSMAQLGLANNAIAANIAGGSSLSITPTAAITRQCVN